MPTYFYHILDIYLAIPPSLSPRPACVRLTGHCQYQRGQGGARLSPLHTGRPDRQEGGGGSLMHPPFPRMRMPLWDQPAPYDDYTPVPPPQVRDAT